MDEFILDRRFVVCGGFAGLVVTGIPSQAAAALIPPAFLNAVVAIGGDRIVSQPGEPVRTAWQTEGTGFFYGYLVQDDPDATKRQYEVYLVTAGHVVRGHVGETMAVRVNPSDLKAAGKSFTIPMKQPDGVPTWNFHPNLNVDVAILRISMQSLRSAGTEVEFFPNDQAAANKKKLSSLAVSAGDGVFVLGFPMNLAGLQRNYVIVRQGGIARIQEMLEGASATFMLDAFVFPGNSGGPVVLRPDVVSIQGTNAQNSAYLMGMVIDYKPYDDVAASLQTKQPRVIFEENSGLADVLPVDVIDEAIIAFRIVSPKQK